MNRFALLLGLLMPFVWAACARAAAPVPKTPGPAKGTRLATLRKAHPRLILTERRLAELKKLAQTDKVLAGYMQAVVARADRYCRKRPLTYRKVGPRLLHVSRECLHRVYTLGLAWRWTGKEIYAKKVRDNILAVCEFKDWNPSHFLDTAEMSHAVGVGYDWLYGWLDEAARAKIRGGLIKLGLTPGLNAYRGKASYGWWRRSRHNWNQVCNGGMIIGALALAETDAQLAEKIVDFAVKSLPLALATYAPDGAWPEGPGYWGYATSYTVFAMAAMDSALGTDFGLSKSDGLATTAMFPIQVTGPIDMFLAFADSGHRRRAMPCQFWLARRFKLPLVAHVERELVSRFGAAALHVVWYVPAPRPAPAPPPLDARFGGPVESAVFRSAWKDTNALFVGVKAGYNQVNHGHLDLGNFELDALGVRWAVDLGGDDYNMPGYWDSRRGGRRWKYYRLGSLSHNVVLLDNQNQDVYGKSKMVKFDSTGKGALAVIDLAGAYGAAARKFARGVRMLPGRRAVLVQDEITLKKTCQVAWGMTTQAKISAQEGRAVLKHDGKELVARILQPAGAKFTVESAEQKPPQRTNRGMRRLMIRLDNQKGQLTIAVLLAPVWPDRKQAKPPVVKPLAQW